MATGMTATPKLQTRTLEDPLDYLPCSTTIEYRKGQVIYGQDQPSKNLYLVIDGKVTICRRSDDGHQVIVDIYQADEFFGESAFVTETQRPETAIALENTRLMVWTINDVEDLVVRRPRLAVALLQLLVRRSMEFESRIESLSVESTERRLAGALIRFSERLGSEAEDGSVRMIPFTHEFLSQYVGTQREVITQHMTHFRRQGYLRYSRKGVELYRDAMKDWMRRKAKAA